MNNALQSLMTRLAALRTSDSGSLTLKSITWAGDDLLMGTEVREYGWASGSWSVQSIEKWQLRCRDVRDSRLVAVNTALGFTIEESHTVLLPYTAPHLELYFRGVCPDADRVVGQLLQAHRNAVGEWFEFMRSLNPAAWSSPSDLLRGGFGRLAAGPQPLIEKYAEVLRQNGLDVSSPPPTKPSWSEWQKGGRTVTEPQPPKVLLLNSCYVVTPEITAERQ
jgi:hypothetical protein